MLTNSKQIDVLFVAIQGRGERVHVLTKSNARNMIACIEQGAMEIINKYDEVMVITPFDLRAKDTTSFICILIKAISVVEK